MNLTVHWRKFFRSASEVSIKIYVDSNTLYKVYDNVDVFIVTFRISAKKLFKQFNRNQIKSSLHKMC